MIATAALATAADLISYHGYTSHNETMYRLGIGLFPLHRLKISIRRAD